jgi:hypothetical protein
MPDAEVHRHPRVRVRRPTVLGGSSRAGHPRATDPRARPAPRIGLGHRGRPDHAGRTGRARPVHPDRVGRIRQGHPVRRARPDRVGRIRQGHPVRRDHAGRIGLARPVRRDRVRPVRPAGVRPVRQAGDHLGRPVRAVREPAVSTPDRRSQRRPQPQWPPRQRRRRGLTRRQLVSVSRSLPVSSRSVDMRPRRILRLSNVCLGQLSAEVTRRRWAT